MQTHAENPPRDPSRLLSMTALVLALGLGAALLMPPLPVARGEMVSQVGEYTVLTTDGGNEELLLLLDARSEDLLVYRIEKQSTVQLFQRVNLPRVFQDAKARARGTK